MKIAMLWHGDKGVEEFWNVPIGLMHAFNKLGHTTDVYKFDAGNCNLEEFSKRMDEYEFAWISWPWFSTTLDSEIKRIRSISKTKLVLELGDEPQTFGQAMERIKYVDAAYTQDLRCLKRYKEMGYNVHWLTHWGDEFLFYYNPEIKRDNVCVTTCGTRVGTDYIKSQLGDLFINKRISAQENNSFYNSGTVSFQYANNDEITRRVMEAGGCKLAVVTNYLSDSTGIYDLFFHGRDIMYYGSPEEAAYQIRFLLNNEDYRNKLAENMYNKVNSFHRAETRCKQILEIVASIP